MDIRPILSSLRRHKTAAALIVLQIALTCAIVCNALFLIQQRIERMDMESGLAEDELVLIQPVSLRGAADGAERDATPDLERTLALLRGIPGVTSVAAVPQMPFGNSSNNTSVSNTPDQVQPTLNAALYMDGGGMLDAFGLRLLSGRDFSSDEYSRRLDAATRHGPRGDRQPGHGRAPVPGRKRSGQAHLRLG